MKILVTLVILLSANSGFAEIYDCFTKIDKNETEIAATYFEKVVGDKIPIRLLKSIEIVSEGEVEFSDSFFFGKLVGGDDIELSSNVSVGIHVGGVSVVYNDTLYNLECSERNGWWKSHNSSSRLDL